METPAVIHAREHTRLRVLKLNVNSRNPGEIQTSMTCHDLGQSCLFNRCIFFSVL